MLSSSAVGAVHCSARAMEATEASAIRQARGRQRAKMRQIVRFMVNVPSNCSAVTKYAQSRKLPLGGCAVWNSYEGKLIRPSNQPRFYETSTLSNRPLAILDDFGQALSFQGQGTGADILASAIASLPEAVSQMLLIPVHDELVFEASATEIDEVRQIVVETMTRAADMVLGGKVPIEVEPVIGETWGKA